uniref:Glycosyl transferase family 28 C-terminal domain-containing protein n=1 Tax=Pyramimonas obovata TaxID=1411642 RepID=A0A7S0RJT0_9CHLO|mmetsp:Transcript_35817/g.78202  ORF Transcript_35817/g.78202 Transcript_35817/m.78202 type:complete len:180 (+) Transcript_35817:348-887(+)|eukprot:CAMPEP_0118926616 /NCGR_PEP_ID=MMETSP1169-20130426/4266_1 /TAXON_ID=36882 /ORGANISM="Pyramimonas obovata, Strain CCMP722" /LENGTH=179 /DNA_ID=CAMNT_0006868205 /DNA_START=275 /DNA_END=814 /DNA_ORIENTATION=+
MPAGGASGEVFVTVGTTLFDALIRAADTAECASALADKGYSSLTLQIGKGSYKPCNAHKILDTKWFEFAPSLGEHMSRASLVISHAGSGSIFEALRAKKPLVVVVNDLLMDNHQKELANELSARKHCVATTPEDLWETIEHLNIDELVEYVPGDPVNLARGIDTVLGVPDVSKSQVSST